MHDKYTGITLTIIENWEYKGKPKGFAFVVYKDAKTSAEVLNKKHVLDGKEV